MLFETGNLKHVSGTGFLAAAGNICIASPSGHP